MSRVAGYWLLSSAVGTAGLVVLGGYVRLRRAQASLTDWKPSSWIYPKDDSDWQYEYQLYKQSDAHHAILKPFDLEQFKDFYQWDWLHRTYAQGLGAYIGLPLLGMWRKLGPGVKGCMLGAAGLGGLMGAVGWFQVYHGLVSPTLPAPESSPIHKTIHQTFGLALYSLLLWGGLTQVRPDSADFIKTLARLQAAKQQRSKYLLALPFLAGTLATGGLVAAKGAGKALINWPWYDNSWLFPVSALDLSPLSRNFTENNAMIQFCHRTCSYITALAVFGLWRVSRGAPLGVTAARFSLFAVSLQLISGVVTLHHYSAFDKSLGHETLSMVVLTSLLVGLHRVRKPINIKSLI